MAGAGELGRGCSRLQRKKPLSKQGGEDEQLGKKMQWKEGKALEGSSRRKIEIHCGSW